MEQRLVTYLKEIGILLGSSVPAEDPDLEIRGTADAVISLNGEERVLEVKSINAAGFEKLKSPPKAHLMQVNAYCHCLGLPEGILLYENKDNQRLREFHVPVDPAIVSEIVKKVRQAQTTIRRLKNEDLFAMRCDMIRPSISTRRSLETVRQTWEEIVRNREKGFLAWLKNWGRYFRSGLAT